MELADQLKCKRPKCNGQMTVPIKVVKKGADIIDVARCPTCRKEYKIMIRPDQEENLIELIKDSIYHCDICGADNFENFVDGETWDMDRVKLVTRCKSCGKKRAKLADEKIMKQIAKLKKPKEESVPEAPPEPKPDEGRTCPSCGEMNDLDHLFCTDCGQPLICEKCRSIIDSGAQFCKVCGAELKK